MALESIIFDKAGTAQLNSLKRYCLSGIVVPRQDLFVAKIPAAQSITQPGRSNPIPLQGPADAFSEMYSFSGDQGLTFQGIGTISTDGATVAVTGVGTKFTTQLQPGDLIRTTVGMGTIATITSDVDATTTLAMPISFGIDYFFSTPVVHENGENIFVSITDQAWRRKLMNRDVPAIHVFGSNQKPEFIKESLLLETDQTLVLEFLNYSSTGPASFAPISEGRKWQYEAMKSKIVYDYIAGLRERKQYIQPYWLTLDKGWSTIPTASQTVEFLTCTGDITLVLFNLYAQAFNDFDGSDASSLVTAQFTDAKTKRSLQSQPVPLGMCAGTAENPFRLSTPLIVEPQTQIQVNFNNPTANGVKAYLTYHGVAIYTGPSFHGSTLTNKHLMEEAGRMYQAMSTPQIIPAEAQ